MCVNFKIKNVVVLKTWLLPNIRKQEEIRFSASRSPFSGGRSLKIWKYKTVLFLCVEGLKLKDRLLRATWLKRRCNPVTTQRPCHSQKSVSLFSFSSCSLLEKFLLDISVLLSLRLVPHNFTVMYFITSYFVEYLPVYHNPLQILVTLVFYFTYQFIILWDVFEKNEFLIRISRLFCANFHVSLVASSLICSP